MNKMITLPPHADRQLIEAMSNDLFEILGPGLGGEFQYAAHCLAHYGESSVVINGVPVDYETLLSVGERFADSEAIRARAKAVRVNNRRYEFLYRR